MSNGEKKLLTIALVFVLLASIDWLFLGPAMNKVKELDDQIAQQKIIIKKDLRVLADKRNIEEEVKEYGKYFTEEIPEEDVVNSEFLKTVESLALKSKVNLVKSNPTEINKQKKFLEHFVSLDCSGSLDDVITFMHSINTSDELLKIVDFNMSPKKGGAGTEVNASMVVSRLLISMN